MNLKCNRVIYLQTLVTALLTCLLIANFLSPYLGVKWEYSFCMFSDLALDCSNHLFMPQGNCLGRRQYFMVTDLQTTDRVPLHARLLNKLLEAAGHPAAGAIDAKTCRPVHRDLLCYHLALFRAEGIDAKLTCIDSATGEVYSLAALTAPEEWLNYSVFMEWPLVRSGYEPIHAALRTATSRSP